ncbi:hypothetical protein PV325_003177 [Microctonus aethiopoides]|nr:hypothetical protein PV325_003177 [Microctonus aethiopoides]KAK0094696.1 hypothetical protein PV326_010263 [Microctonus aethiopoides]
MEYRGVLVEPVLRLTGQEEEEGTTIATEKADEEKEKLLLPVSVELLMVLLAVEMAEWLVTGVPMVFDAVVEELFGDSAAVAACA